MGRTSSWTRNHIGKSRALNIEARPYPSAYERRLDAGIGPDGKSARRLQTMWCNAARMFPTDSALRILGNYRACLRRCCATARACPQNHERLAIFRKRGSECQRTCCSLVPEGGSASWQRPGNSIPNRDRRFSSRPLGASSSSDPGYATGRDEYVKTLMLSQRALQQHLDSSPALRFELQLQREQTLAQAEYQKMASDVSLHFNFR